jgi:hypothetical protein
MINKINNNNKKQFETLSRLLEELAICKVRKPPSSEMMGKTANGTATEGICRETGTICSMPVATWTLSTNRTQGADWDTNDEAIFILFSKFFD